MEKDYKIDSDNLAELIKDGAIGVLPTDTLYGLVGSALSEEAVRKIHRIKDRSAGKPFIILIGSLEDLDVFGIKIGQKEKEFLEKIWPGKVSVVLPCPEEKFSYLHRGTKTLALRWPEKKNLTDLLEETGPLAAPSANPKGSMFAENIDEAKNYFGDQVDFYVDGGELNSLPSTLISLENGKVKILREGAVKM